LENIRNIANKMAVKIKITYVCDKCGKKHVENLEMRGYDDVGDFISDQDEGYMPEGWSVQYTGEKSILHCRKCTKEEDKNETPSIVAA
jgi:hypothetical protein